MSLSPETGKVRVVADPGSPASLVSITDGSYRTIAESVGRLETKLAPGVYKIRYSSGTEIEDHLFEVVPSAEPLTAPVSSLKVCTPAPLLDSTSHEQDQSLLAVELSTSSPIERGLGSELFIFVRVLPACSEELIGAAAPGIEVTPAGATASEPAQSPVESGHPAAGLKLMNFNGEVLYDFAATTPVAGCVGANLRLTPGSYLLRLERPGDRAIEQTIVTCAGWQTQVFLPRVFLSTNDTNRRPGLDSAAVFMAPVGVGFRSDAVEAGWVEQARHWLARGEPLPPRGGMTEAAAEAKAGGAKVADDEVLTRMMHERFTNPMLGLYAAHLMMLDPNYDAALMRELSANLRRMLGHHPDVEAIDLWLEPNPNPPRFESPPMLRSSWNVVVNRSRESESVAPHGSYTLRITGLLWGCGAWLVWCAPPPVETSEPVPAATTAQWDAIREYWTKNLARTTVAQYMRQHAAERVLDPVETAVLTYVGNAVQMEVIARQVTRKLDAIGIGKYFLKYLRPLVASELTNRAKAAATVLLDKSTMAQRLNVPPAALDAAAAALTRKLGFTDQRRVE